jgi:predicted nicotinamide N-methyase
MVVASTAENEPSIVQTQEIDLLESGSSSNDDYFADVGFMFEAQQPVRLERFHWDLSKSCQSNDAINSIDDECDGSFSATNRKGISVALHVADDIPGAVQSGHYLWPAAAMLSEYLIKNYSYNRRNATAISRTACDQSPSILMRHKNTPVIRTVVELGAGCALTSLAALQLWQDTIQCLCVTDHDPGTLVRARDNLETTLQLLLEDCNDDDDCDEQLNAAINNIASIPVLFETLEWGDITTVDTMIHNLIQEHLPSSILSSNEGQNQGNLGSFANDSAKTLPAYIDIVLGSDLIYCMEVVRPLFCTATQLMGHTGRFILAQSFLYDDSTEKEIDRVCNLFNLRRRIAVDFASDTLGSGRIQEFYVDDMSAIVEKEDG